MLLAAPGRSPLSASSISRLLNPGVAGDHAQRAHHAAGADGSARPRPAKRAPHPRLAAVRGPRSRSRAPRYGSTTKRISDGASSTSGRPSASAQPRADHRQDRHHQQLRDQGRRRCQLAANDHLAAARVQHLAPARRAHDGCPRSEEAHRGALSASSRLAHRGSSSRNASSADRPAAIRSSQRLLAARPPPPTVPESRSRSLRKRRRNAIPDGFRGPGERPRRQPARGGPRLNQTGATGSSRLACSPRKRVQTACPRGLPCDGGGILTEAA